MKILLTNQWLDRHGGTEVYVRDLSLALHNKGITVEVYSPKLGRVAHEIKKAGVRVVDSIDSLFNVPDIIHAHHFTPAMAAIQKFKDVPVLYFQHDRLSPVDSPPKHSRIIKYIAVDFNCLDRLLIDNEIEQKDTAVLYNWVDTSRFKLRKIFSEKPLTALVFSNYADRYNHFNVIRAACEAEGVRLDGLGVGFGKVKAHPEEIVGNYDLVFAKAKAAMEALATGAGVIVCDFAGLAEIVNTNNFDYFRRFNFGMKTMTRPIEKDLIISEIRKYDANQNQKAAAMIREKASFERFIEKIIALYSETIRTHQKGGMRPDIHDEQTVANFQEIKKKSRQDLFKKKIRSLLTKADLLFLDGKLIYSLTPAYKWIFMRFRKILQ